MADKRIQDLTAATSVGTADLFVLEQSGQAKSLSGQVLINDLATALDGHGGINSITYTAPVSPSLAGTLTITLADETVVTLSVTNGRGITSITSSSSGLTDTYTLHYNDGTTSTFAVTNGTGIVSIAKTATVGLVDTYTITYNDGDTDTFDVTNGRGISNITWESSGTAGDGMTHTGTISYNDGSVSSVTFQDGLKGDQGDQTYVWFKWSQDYPTQDSDMQNSVAPYIGIYSGTASSAPTTYTSYAWYKYQGDKGDTGSNIQSIAKTSTAGLVDTYTVTLTDGNTTTFTVTNAKSIVSVTSSQGANPIPGTVNTITITFNDGDTAVFYVYNGQNGTGSVSTVSGIQADGNGDVPQMTIGSGAPTTSTVGQQNQLYYDIQTSILYVCNGENSGTAGTYDWYGTGVTVDNYLSTSSTNPAQNKVITTKLGTTPLTTTAQNCSDAINEHETDIGNMSLTTTATTLSGAVNELDGDITTINGKIGSVSMPTTAQTLTGAVAELDADIKTYARPNLLDNWYFVGGGSQRGVGSLPINSKGQTSYSSLSGTTCIDRWAGYNNLGVTLVTGGTNITGAASSPFPALIQFTKLTTEEIRNKTLTLSFLLSTGIVIATGAIPNTPSTSTNYLYTADSTQHCIIQFYLNSSGQWAVQVSSNQSSGIALLAAKLEIGDTQTLAHQVNGAWVLNEMPLYEVELLKCSDSGNTTFVDGSYYRKMGNLCVLTFRSSSTITTGATNEWKSIGTLPVGYRPNDRTYGVLGAGSHNSTYYATVKVEATGDVSVCCAQVANIAYLAGTVTFFTN